MNRDAVLFLQRGDWESMHQALSIAAAIVAAGGSVEFFFSWWALERLLRDDLDVPRLAPPAGLLSDEERAALEEHFAEKQFPSLRQLLTACKESGRAHLTACSGSLALLGRSRSELEGKVDDLAGWSTILERCVGTTERFFF